jgi:hypothetical protein
MYKSLEKITYSFCSAGHASVSKKGCEMGPSVDKLINPIRRDTSCIDDDSHVENTSCTKIII